MLILKGKQPVFETLPALAPDPILGLSASYKADTNPHKIDLGVGVYKDENGNTPILKAVSMAQSVLQESERSKVYITPQGHQGYIDSMLALMLGAKHKVISDSRVAAVQAPGGCGALRILAELLVRCNKDTVVWVSDCLSEVKKGDVVLLHGCCHNPTGADLTQSQWQALADLAVKNGFLPFVDVAYQGFGDGLNEDAYGLRLLAESVDEMIIAASCSKNFGLYRERVGLAAIITKDTDTRKIAQSQIQSVARGIYSMPPSYGGSMCSS